MGPGGPPDDRRTRTVRHTHELSLRSLFSVLAVAAGLWLLARLWQILLLLVIALILAGTISPLIGWLERHHVRRTLGLGLVLLAVVLAVAALGALLLPALVAQGPALVAAAPTIQGRLADYLAGVPTLAGGADAVRGAQQPGCSNRSAPTPSLSRVLRPRWSCWG